MGAVAVTSGRRSRFARAALVYLGLSGVWMYGFLDRGAHESSDLLAWSAITAIAVAHIVFGFAVREWLALLLPIAVVFLAIPAGYPESRFSEPGPLWFGQVMLVQVEIPLIALGLGLRSLVDRRRAVARAS